MRPSSVKPRGLKLKLENVTPLAAPGATKPSRATSVRPPSISAKYPLGLRTPEMLAQKAVRPKSFKRGDGVSS